jgi:hypothetical protein
MFRGIQFGFDFMIPGYLPERTYRNQKSKSGLNGKGEERDLVIARRHGTESQKRKCSNG